MNTYLLIMLSILVTACSMDQTSGESSIEAAHSGLRCRCEGRINSQNPYLPAKWAYVRRNNAGVAVSSSDIFATQDICRKMLRADDLCVFVDM